MIRVLTVHDARAYAQVRREALREEPLAFGEAVEEHERRSSERFAELMRETGGIAMGVFDSETLVGLLRFVQETGRKDRHKSSIRSVDLRLSHRGTGLGTALLAAAIERAALGLYESNRFVRFGTEPRALCVDGHYVDEHHMLLRLR